VIISDATLQGDDLKKPDFMRYLIAITRAAQWLNSSFRLHPSSLPLGSHRSRPTICWVAPM
jgi:hypothetical protein